MWQKIVFLFFTFLVMLKCFSIDDTLKGKKLAVVNYEKTYNNQTYQECAKLRGCKFSDLSCRYLDAINSTTVLKQYYRTPEDGKRAVRSGEALGALYFTENFTDAYVARLALARDADDETLDQSQIRMWVDMSSPLHGILLEGYLRSAYQIFEKGLLNDCEQNEKLADPFLVHELISTKVVVKNA